MKWYYFILIIIILLIIILFNTKLRLHMYKRGNGFGIIKLKLGFIPLKYIDLGSSLFNMLETHPLKSNIKNMFVNMQIVIDSNRLVKDYLKATTINKITFISKYNSESPIIMPYICIINWSIISIIKRLTNEYFRDVKEEYYQTYLNDESKKGIDMELECETKLGSIILVGIKNIKLLFSMIKRLKKEGKIYGKFESTSKRFVENSHELT